MLTYFVSLASIHYCIQQEKPKKLNFFSHKFLVLISFIFDFIFLIKCPARNALKTFVTMTTYFLVSIYFGTCGGGGSPQINKNNRNMSLKGN